EPPHTAPTAQIACPAPNTLETPSASSAQNRRPRHAQSCRPLRSAQTRRPPIRAQASHMASRLYIEDIMDMALPLEFSAPVLSPLSLSSPSPPSSQLVLSSPPTRPEPAPPEHPPELFPACGPFNFQLYSPVCFLSKKDFILTTKISIYP
ncbi:hypothetical protein M9458_002707, partial [Cirrhinus mrigala]